MNLNQVTVPSLDLEKSAAFYKKLGLQLIVDSIPHYARFLCPEGGATFSLHRVEKLLSGEGVSVYFECEDLDQRVAQLKKEGIQFVHDPVDQKWLWREALLHDPDGNRIILYFAGEHRINPPWRVN